MKKYSYLIIILLSSLTNAQVAIGKDSVSNASVSLEFAEGYKGLILPWVNTTNPNTVAVDGTLLFDTSDYRIKYRANDQWSDISVDPNGIADLNLQNDKIEKSDAQAVIGKEASTNTIPGILVLSDDDKAMILPKMASPHLNIKNPEPGTIAYDTVNRQLAVYNGRFWSFWKP